MKTLFLAGLLSLTLNVTSALSLPQCRPTDLQPIGCEGAVCICSKKTGICEWVGCI